METKPEARLSVAILGAGPVGLAAAAHVLEYGWTPQIFESSDSVGASLREFRHVQLFSSWRYNVDRASRSLLESHGWTMPQDNENPTAGEMLDRYLVPLSRIDDIHANLHFNSRVVAVARKGYDKVKSRGRENAPFIIRVEHNGKLQEFLASAVIDATGTWFQPNPLGANGLPAIGENTIRHRLEYGMPDVLGELRTRYQGKTTAVVGTGHSAVGSLIALVELLETDPQATIHWILRGPSTAKVFGGGDADQLPARGALGVRLHALVEQGKVIVHNNFRIHEVYEEEGGITIVPEESFDDVSTIHGVDQIICATGSRPNLDMVRELRVRTDALLESSEALAPLIDPNIHSCGTVRPHGHKELSHPESGFYIVGAKSYGRAPTFLLATGYEQVRSVAAALAGDMAAADNVQLDLPETGVCSSNIGGVSTDNSCCAGNSPQDSLQIISLTEGHLEASTPCGCGSASAIADRPVSSCCS